MLVPCFYTLPQALGSLGDRDLGVGELTLLHLGPWGWDTVHQALHFVAGGAEQSVGPGGWSRSASLRTRPWSTLSSSQTWTPQSCSGLDAPRILPSCILVILLRKLRFHAFCPLFGALVSGWWHIQTLIWGEFLLSCFPPVGVFWPLDPRCASSPPGRADCVVPDSCQLTLLSR